jgi:hypothetical protein
VLRCAGCVAFGFPELVVAVYASARRLQPISVAAMPQGAVCVALNEVPVLYSGKRAEHTSTCYYYKVVLFSGLRKNAPQSWNYG